MAPMSRTTRRVIGIVEDAHEQLSDALRTALLALQAIEEGHRTPAAHARLAIDTIQKSLAPGAAREPHPTTIVTAAEIEEVKAKLDEVEARRRARSHAPDATSLTAKSHEGEPCSHCHSTDTEGEGGGLVCHNCGLMPANSED